MIEHFKCDSICRSFVPNVILFQYDLLKDSI